MTFYEDLTPEDSAEMRAAATPKEPCKRCRGFGYVTKPVGLASPTSWGTVTVSCSNGCPPPVLINSR